MQHAGRILEGVKVVLFPPNLAASEGDRHPALHSSLSSRLWLFWLHSHPEFGSWGSANEGVGSGGSLPKRGSRAKEGAGSSARSWEARSELVAVFALTPSVILGSFSAQGAGTGETSGG